MVEPIAFTQTIANWHKLTRPRASELEDTRKQLHWASQLVSAVGTSLCPARSDDSHTNLEWSNAHHGLLGRTSPTTPQLRAVLQFPRLTVELLRDQGGGNEKTVLSLPLANMTFSQAFARLEAAVAEQLGRSDFHLHRPKHQLPAHRVDPDGEGAPFGGWEKHAIAELVSWFANGDRALRELREHDGRATEVRCWPHNFDIATLIVLERERPDDPTSEVTRSVGVGMTPGDGSYADAYWYVTPWPCAATPKLPQLAGGGIWHQDGWVGAVLTSTALREPQAETFAAFMRSALAAVEALVV
jgi:hypothetical protein